MVTGSEGMLGSYVNFGVRFTKQTLDVTNLDAVLSVCHEYKPSTVVHLAGLTDLVFCERNPREAYLVNTTGTYHLALAARAIGAKLVYVSTSGVFDGTKKEPYTEEDVPNPVNVYGHSKYLGELAVRGILNDYLIVRTSWLFGGGRDSDKKFVGKILAQQNAIEVRAVTDKRGSPTYAKDLAGALKKLIEENRKGIVHVGGGVATRYDVSREALALIGSKASVVPVLSTEFSNVYLSGENESMSSSSYVRPWQEALAEYIEIEWKI